MKILRWLDTVLYKLEAGILAFSLGVMVLLAFLQVVLRNLFGTGFIWGDTLVRHLVLWVGFFGAALAVKEERHISIDALTKFLSPRTKRIAWVLTSAFAMVVCLYLSEAAWVYLKEEHAAGSQLVLSIPSWVGLMIIPIGYLLLAVHFCVRVVEHGAKAFGKTAETR